jgi:hypothetical protein
MVYLNVKLLNDSIDKSTADIVPRQTPQGFVYYVYSENPKMKSHLETLLTYSAYIAAPGRNDVNFFADSVMFLQPNSLYYLNALPEILSWRGYDATVQTGVHKSLDFNEFFYVDSIKSADSGITYNQEGQRIVKYVPQGYIAVHSDGRTVAGGRYLNANIDKQGADWTLMQNPYEGQTPDQRQQVKQFMDVGLEDYHPGVEEGPYLDIGEDESRQYRVDRDYKPSGVSLDEHFKESTQRSEAPVPSNYPTQLEAGHIVYSPETGQAFSSEFWPPEGIDYQKNKWYIFTGNSLTDEEKNLYGSIRGMSPDLIPGISSGVVQSEIGLDVSSGFLIGNSMPSSEMTDLNTGSSQMIRVNAPEQPNFEIREMLDSGWKASYKKAADVLRPIKELTRGAIDPSLEEMQIEGLRGSEAVFSASLYPYQKPVVEALVQPEQYEVYGGPRGWHGHFLNVQMGLGKTAIVTAAVAVMRNKGLVRNGEQTTIITAPNKNVYVWQQEVGKFLGENAIVIDGDRETRIRQWEEVLSLAKTSEIPPFVVVGSSKFRQTRGDFDDDTDDQWELDTDAQFMRLLSMGGSYGESPVAGNHVGIFIVDESGQYVNPEAARHKALLDVTDAVYRGKGITWTLNGTISGNSATDTISELSFINKYVRDNYMALAMEYTKTNTDSTRENKSLGRRVWKDSQRTKDFFYTFGNQVYSLDTRNMHDGMSTTEDSLTPMGAEWGKVYLDAERKLAAAVDGNSGNRVMGLLSILINSGFGAVSPARLIEYDLGSSSFYASMEKRLSGAELKEYVEQYKEFVSKTTEVIPGVGRVPMQRMPVSDRDVAYQLSFSPKFREIMDSVADDWECPYTDNIVRSIQGDFEQNVEAGRNYKVGVAGFSKTSIRKIYRRLSSNFSSRECLIQVVDGDTSAEEVNNIQTRHQGEKDRNVVTLVTGAGTYGLSLPSDRTYRAAAWNSARGLQIGKRFHRNPKQKNILTVSIPSGITQYMRELELRKGSMASSATNVLLEVEDEGDELVLNSNSMSKLLDKLAQYRPRILERE